MLLDEAHLLLELLVLIEHEGIDLPDLLEAVEVLGGQAELVQSLQLLLRGGGLGLDGFLGGRAIRGLRAPFLLRLEEVVPDLNIFLLRRAALWAVLLICWGFRIAADFLDPLARHLQVSNLLLERLFEHGVLLLSKDAVHLGVAVNGLIGADNTAGLHGLFLGAQHAVALVAAHGRSVVGIAHFPYLAIYNWRVLVFGNKRKEMREWKSGDKEKGNVGSGLLVGCGFLEILGFC